MTTAPTAPLARSRIACIVLAALGCLVAAAVPVWFAHEDTWDTVLYKIALSYSVVLVAAGVLALCRSRGAQLLARSIWWSTFGASVLVALFAARDREVAYPALVMVLATSTSLLATGRTGLRAAEHHLAPAAYPGAIMVSMIMALADAQALGWLGSTLIYAASRRHGDLMDILEAREGLAMLVCCAIALWALYGLYRLRLWGLVLSAATTAAFGALSFTRVFGFGNAGPIPYAFALSAAVQLALLAPLFIAIIRRRAPSPPSPRAQRLARIAPVAVIVALAALSVVTVTTSHSLIRF